MTQRTQPSVAIIGLGIWAAAWQPTCLRVATFYTRTILTRRSLIFTRKRCSNPSKTCSSSYQIYSDYRFNHLSSKVFRITQHPGDGVRTKLVNSLLAGINLVGAAEALALAQRMGLNLQTTLDVIKQSSGQSWIGTDRM